MYGLVDENGEYDEDAVQMLQEQLAEAAGPQEDPRDSTRHDMIFHWVVFVSGFIVAVRTCHDLRVHCGQASTSRMFVALLRLELIFFGH